MEVNFLILIILGIIIFSIILIVIFSMVWPSKFSAFLKEACLLTVGKFFAQPYICEAFRVAE